MICGERFLRWNRSRGFLHNLWNSIFVFCFDFFFFGFVRINAHIYESPIRRCVFSWRFLEFGALIGFNFNIFFLPWLGNLSLRNRI